jgi:hypothetical protein
MKIENKNETPQSIAGVAKNNRRWSTVVSLTIRFRILMAMFAICPMTTVDHSDGNNKDGGAPIECVSTRNVQP